MYEHNVKPELELAVQLLHSIDYFSQTPVEIAGITGRAIGILNAMLICHPNKELVWKMATSRTLTAHNRSESQYTAPSEDSVPTLRK